MLKPNPALSRSKEGKGEERGGAHLNKPILLICFKIGFVIIIIFLKSCRLLIIMNIATNTTGRRR
jgi:hypothetical protein